MRAVGEGRAGSARRRDLRGPRRRGQGRSDQADHGVPEPTRRPASSRSPRPTERERGQWYFQRYVAHLPAAGEIVLFDRSWYNRAGVEHVLGFCTPEEYRRFLRQCPIFERLLVEDGITLVKYWFSVSDEEQERRFRSRLEDPMRRWKLSPTDLESRPAGSTTPGRRTRCSCTPTSRRRRGGSSRATTSAAPGSTASPTC